MFLLQIAFNQFGRQLQRVAQPQDAVPGVGQHPEGDVFDTEGDVALARWVEAYADMLRDVGGKAVTHALLRLLGDDDDPQPAVVAFRKLAQTFERGEPRRGRRMEELDVGQRRWSRPAVGEPCGDSQLGCAFPDEDALSVRRIAPCQRKKRYFFMACGVIRKRRYELFVRWTNFRGISCENRAAAYFSAALRPLLRLLLRPFLRPASWPASPVCFSACFSGPLLAGPLSASLQPLYLRSSLSAGSCSGPCRRARPPVRAALIGPGLARRLVCSGPFLSERADGFRPSREAFG